MPHKKTKKKSSRPSFAGTARAAASNPLEVLRLLTVGATSPELLSASMGRNVDIAPAPAGLRGDKALHAIASRELTQRFGPTIANLIGFAQEVPTGLNNQVVNLDPRTGGFFAKDKGFDFADIAANQVGIQQALGRAKGGQVPKWTRKARKMQTGGGLPSVGGLMGRVTNIGRQLETLSPQITAPTGQLTSTSRRLQGFNPLGGAAGNTLKEIVETGRAVDVDPLIRAAQMRAQHGFQDFLGQSREQFGALGLGSSSAARAAEAREAGRLQDLVAARGLEAGVAAQESARGRQLQAFNPFLAGRGQQLSGLQAAGGLQGQAAGLGLQQQIAMAQMRQQGLQGAGQLSLGQAGLAQQDRQQALAGGAVPPATPGVMAFTSGSRRPQRRTPAPQPAGFFGRGAPSGSNQGLQVRRGFQGGGRVNEADFLSNLLYGAAFQPRQQLLPFANQNILNQSARLPQFSRSTAPTNNPDPIRLPRIRGRSDDGVADRARAAALGRLLGLSAANSRIPSGDVARIAGLLGTRPVHAGLMQSGRLLARQATGGVVPGPAVPPDSVPAEVGSPDGIPEVMLQGGEGIIPVPTMDRLENSNSDDPLVQELQAIMAQNPHPSKKHQREIERKQRGGKISKVMGEFKRGTLKSSSGDTVTDRKQAIAIALSEAREMKEGGKIPGGFEETEGMQRGGSIRDLIQRLLGTQAPTAAPEAFTASADDAAIGLPALAQPQPQAPAQAPADAGGVPSFSLTGDPNEAPEVSQGRIISPTEDAERLFHQARSRLNLLRTFAARNRGVQERLAPSLAEAQAEVQSALENLQGTQALEQSAQQAEAQRQFLGQEQQLDRESAERMQAERSAATIAAAGAGEIDPGTAARLRAAESANEIAAPLPVAGQGLAGEVPGAAPPPTLADQISQMAPDDAEVMLGILLRSDPEGIGPQFKPVAEQILADLLNSGIDDETLMARYPTLIALAD